MRNNPAEVLSALSLEISGTRRVNSLCLRTGGLIGAVTATVTPYAKLANAFAFFADFRFGLIPVHPMVTPKIDDRAIFWRAVDWIPSSGSESFAHGQRLYERIARDGYGETQEIAPVPIRVVLLRRQR
jgi:hypothetical protein